MDVDPEGQLPFLIGNILDRLEARLVRGVVDEDIDAAEFFACGLNDLAAMRGGLDIAGEEYGLAPGFLDEALRILCCSRSPQDEKRQKQLDPNIPMGEDS